jgi:hypothetical protein
VSGQGLSASPSGPVRGTESTPDKADDSLAYSRGRLQALAAADEIVQTEIYWLYEHLQRSSREANRLLDEFQGYTEIPITSGAVLMKFIRPLEEIRKDLAEHYWPNGCLLEDLAIAEFDKEMVETIRVIRTDWARLISAIQEYLNTHQTKGEFGQADREHASETFHLMFLNFADTLSSLVNRPVFTRRHSELASTLGIQPLAGPKRRRIR